MPCSKAGTGSSGPVPRTACCASTAASSSSTTPATACRDDFVEVLHEDRGGRLWIGTQSGLGRLHDGRFTAYTVADGLPDEYVQAFLEDRDGGLWIGTRKGLVRWTEEGFVPVLGEVLGETPVAALWEDREGRLWIGTGGRGLARRDADGLRFFNTRDGLASDDVSALLEDSDGNLWIGTRDAGTSRLTGDRFYNFDTAAGLSDNDVRVIVEDHEKSLWIGTWTGGLNRLRDGRFLPWTSREGLADDMVLPILEDRGGDLWIGTQNGLSRFRDGEFETWTAADGLAHDTVWALHEDRAGDLWIGTQNGLSRFRDGTFRSWTSADGLAHDEIHALLEDSEGALWIGTSGGGLSRFRDGVFTTYTERDGLAQNLVMALHEDRSGALWIGTTGGLSRWHDGAFTTWTTAEGLPNNAIPSFHEDADGALWIGTDGGLVRYRQGQFAVFTTADGLFNNKIFQIFEDDAGYLWGSCNRGIFRVAKAELEELAAGRRDHVTSVAYGTADGMKSHECNGSYQPAGWRTRDGRLWFPTVRGAVSIDPGHIPVNEHPPPVVIDRLVTETGSLPLTAHDEGRLEPDVRDFAIRYTGLSFRRPEAVTFRYFLEGYHDEWLDAGTQREARFTNLPPGTYRFRVEARNEDGVRSPSEASIELFVRPRFWETWPFYGLCALILLGLGRGAYRWRVRQLLRHNRELKAMKSELEAQNAELERFTYTVSHDLKSPLFTIQGFLGYLERDAEQGDLDRLREDVQRIQQAVRHMQQALEELLELSRVGRTVESREEVALGDAIAEAVELVARRIAERGVELVVAPELPVVTADRRRLVEVFQNLIDNAAKYMGEQDTPRVEIDAEQRQDEVLVRVRDNGLGIDPRFHTTIFGLFDKLDPTSDGTGIGLALVQRVIGVHGGKIWVDSAGEGHGATFSFTLPAA